MLNAEQRRTCLEQAIDIVKHAPADNLATHDRLKRVYKRLVSLTEQLQQNDAPGKSGKDAKIATKKA